MVFCISTVENPLKGILISTVENHLNGILKSNNRKPLIWYSKNVTTENHQKDTLNTIYFTAENHLLITVYEQIKMFLLYYMIYRKDFSKE